MSTFDGFVPEFPHIAIDYFRPRAPGSPAVFAYLLSHVHSDHLQGLDDPSFGGAFIYASEATCALLLELQTKYARQRVAGNVPLERSCKYGHLRPSHGKQLLRTLPMDVPVQLTVENEVMQVTLLPANHCPGACMFLLESKKHYVLYTGDVRAERNFTSQLKLHPVLLPYLSSLKRLDALYLDTSARPHGPAYASKMSGSLACIKAMLQYPSTANFMVPASCLGYEEFWLAAARALQTKIHVDQYTMTLFRSVRTVYTFGEAFVGDYGILTLDSSEARLHACLELLEPCIAASAAVYIKAVTSITFRQQPGSSESQIEAETDLEESITLHNFARGDTPLLLGEAGPNAVEGHLPRSLIVEFARHSSWPELEHLVSMFTPRRVVSCVGNVGHLFEQFTRNDASRGPLRAREVLNQSEGLEHIGEYTFDVLHAQSNDKLFFKQEAVSQSQMRMTDHRTSQPAEPEIVAPVAVDMIEQYQRYATEGRWSDTPRIKRQALSQDVYL